MIHHQHVAIARAGRSAFHGHIGRHRISGMITFAVELKRHLHFGLRTRHVNKRNANGSAIPNPRAKIGVRGLAGAYRRHVRV